MLPNMAANGADYPNALVKAILNRVLCEILFLSDTIGKLKKNKKGIATPKNHIELIEQRLRKARKYHDKHQKQ
ncbi:hypothetical protein SAMN05216302_10134 [Nitrosomonas aestuarii]|uniref:Uncharacterized protein n=1 Tax=Nitrosomonas aestuarii TaxID=52441 RepID=A0A1I4BQ02_9PROT|nr:hypothetical protein SAMN05216302_10134 [Nitrosomonas aestuarii]